MGIRRSAREAALQILYGLEYAKQPGVEPFIAEFWGRFTRESDAEFGDLPGVEPEETGEGKPTPPEREYADVLVRGVLDHRDTLDKTIREASTNWRLDRMAVVDRNILRLATYELVHQSDVPPRVALNEAIEIGKRFGSEDSGSFINGILDRIGARVRPN